MKIGIKVGDVMTRHLVSVKPSEGVVSCAREMADKDVGLIIVEKAGKLLGVLTERDVIWALTKKGNLSNVKAGDIMLRKITTIKPSRDLYEALVRMQKTKTRWLPITVNKRVIGVLTMNDILRIEPGLFDIVAGNMNIRETEEKMRRKEDASSGKVRWWEEGECDNCQAFGLLTNLGGDLLCDPCQNLEYAGVEGLGNADSENIQDQQEEL